MMTFMHFIPARAGRFLTVTMDMAPGDIVVHDATTKQMVTDANKAKRKFCAIHHEHIGTTLFSYDPANQARIEEQLLAILSGPHSEVMVNAEAGGVEAWASY